MIYDDYEAAFGESASHTLDLNTWVPGEELPALYNTLERQVRKAVEEEDARCAHVRSTVFPALAELVHAVPDSGCYQLTAELVEKAHRGFLFNGAVEASDGTIAIHDALPVTITQVGICLVSYNGASGSYAHRLFHKDLRLSGITSAEKLWELIQHRELGSAIGNDVEQPFNSLFTRGIMAWAERAFLLKRSNARWRMGHGNPTPYELFSGSWGHKPEMIDAALNLMRELVEHRRFVYVPSTTSQRELLTLGYALRPLEYLILTTQEDYFERVMANSGYRGESLRKLEDFARDVGPQIVRGVYRVSRDSPPYLFYAHKDCAHDAALIAIADSTLQLHRGFPMLIDLADRICGATFGAGDFLASVRLAYGDAGQSYNYFGERETRS